MGFLAPISALLLLLVPPLVLLYFLKLKRPQMEIPSLVLWRQVLDDHRVNAPFQRFRRHLLLWLQLLLLALLVLAAMQPYVRGGSERATNIPVLIDHSASMAARATEGGPTRLEEAKAKVRAIIDGLLPNQRVCLIAFADSARKLTEFTNNHRLLHDALDRIEVRDVPSNVEDAMRVTQALARSTPFEEAILFSDGNLPASARFDLPFHVSYQRLETGGPNVGITALSAKRGGEGRRDVFVSLEASSDQALTATLEARQDGQLLTTEPVSLSRARGERILFPVQATRQTHLEVRLRPDGFDALASDNAAHLQLDPARQLDVRVPLELASYRVALRAVPGVRLWPRDANDPGPASYDLLITDQPDDLALVSNVTLSVGLVPEDIKSLLQIQREPSDVVDWRRNVPLLEHVELSDLVVLDQSVTHEPVREGDFENRGYEVLIYGRQGPLLLRKREGTQLTYAMLFHSDRSTLPYRVAFPVLLTNLVRIAMHEAGLLEASGARTGVLAPLRGLQPEASYTIRGPDGITQEVQADRFGVLAGVAAPRVGDYAVDGPGFQTSLAVSLLSPEETQLEAVEEIQFNEVAVAAAATPLDVDRSLWWPLALVGLGVLVVEWWVYQRKPGGRRQ